MDAQSEPVGLLDVAVYGTLKRGGSNHHWLAGARWMGAFQSAPVYDLFDLGSYPAAVPGGGHALALEVYRVTPTQLAALDTLEEHPTVYHRACRDVAGFGRVWLYEMDLATVEARYGTRARRLTVAAWPPR